MSLRLENLSRCFQGVVPSSIATVSNEGVPNVTYISQVHYVDAKHVALSCQFFNKTRRNLAEHPLACVEVYDPLTFEAYRLRLRFLRAETSGPLYDAMALRIQAIASQTGMTGVFRLLSADVFEVISLDRHEGFLLPPSPVDPAQPLFDSEGPMNELRGLQLVSERINRSRDLEALLTDVLAALNEAFGFAHAMILLPDETGERLVALASQGYEGRGIGAEVRLGEGLIGTVAQQRQLLRVSGVEAEMRYGRAIRGRVLESGGSAPMPEVPLPGLADAQSQLAIPLVLQDRLVGVLAVESRDRMRFADWHEAYLQILANQIAIAIDRMSDDEPEGEEPAPAAIEGGGHTRAFVLYRNDDCVFVDGEYLIRNIPAKILWRLLRVHQAEGRTEFSNRELRLDPSLGLPPIKDNLESRLILLRKRLALKCPDVRLTPTGRGRFTLELGCALELIERDSASS